MLARVTKEQKLVRAEAGLQRLAKQLGNVSQARKTLGYICSPARTVTSIHTKQGVQGDWVAPRFATAIDARQSHAAGPPGKPETPHRRQAR